ncbi:MAG: hypothetical protein IJ437_07190 [Clostridia bacterium]|nr:hypothetical protein [Clostridia bacterium]
MKLSSLKFISKKTVPYALIFVFSLIGTVLVLWNGLNKGDDFFYHIPNILDKYNSILNGNGLSGISSEIANGFGYGAGLFYSPLSHFTVAVLGACLNLFGISLMTSYKIVLVLSVFLSGVFMYDFAMKFTSNNKVASLLASSCLIIYPYRLFNMFCRVAFAEAFAFTFMPLFLCGVYEITHMEKEQIKTLPFIKLIIGASFIFLSHNLTALFAFIVGFLFFLLYTKRLIKLFTSKKYLILCGISALLVIGICAIALFSQLELLGSDYYAVSNDVSMRTDLASVLKHVGRSWLYSGFLNVSFLSGLGYTTSNLYNGIVMFLIGCVVFVAVDSILGKISKLKYFHHLISVIPLVVIISLTSQRLEIYLGAFVFVVLYTLISTHEGKECEKRVIYKRPIFWFTISVLVMTFFVMSSEWVWKIAPDFLRTIQFPWRLWSLVQMFLSVLVGLLAQHFTKRRTLLSLVAIFIGLLLVLNMPILEKRNASDEKWFDEISDTYLDKSSAMGHQKEYCPQIYLEKDYTPCENSLYDDVRSIIFRSNYNRNKKLSPAILTGDGEIVVNSLTAPRSEMDIELSEKSEIQMPLFYYPGYKVYIESANGEKATITPHDVDGLISFELEAGKYTVKTDYVGTPLRIVGKTLTVLSSGLALALLGYAIWKETNIKMLFYKIKNKARK